MRLPQGNREGFLECLRHLYGRLRGYTIWLYVDRAQWHRGEQVNSFVKTHVRLHLKNLPGYQPALNVQERLWRQLRYEATTNHWFESLDAVWESIRTTTRSWSPNKVKRLCTIT